MARRSTMTFREQSLMQRKDSSTLKPPKQLNDRRLSPSPSRLPLPPVKLTKVTQLDVSDRSVSGVARIKDRLYLVCQGSNTVFVYTIDDPYSKLDDINIPDMNWPWDICASETTNRIYITDFLYACVWLLTVEDGKVVRWLNSLCQPYTISSTADGRVLIPRQGHPSNIDIYDQDSTLVRSVALPDNIDVLNHAIETPGQGTLIVSFGGTDSPSHGLLELSLDGQVMRRFPEEDSPAHRPYYVTIDWMGRVIVADYHNHKVIRLDSEFKLDRVLVSQEENGLNGPQRLLFDPNKEQLFVVHFKGVDVFCVGKDS